MKVAEFFMPILYFLRDISNPFLDGLFALITHLGEEIVFLVVAIVFFWCVNKREGYFILITGLFGTIINQAAIDVGIIRLICIVSTAPMHAMLNVNNGILQASGKPTLQMVVNLLGVCGFRGLWMMLIYPMWKTPTALYIAYPISFGLVFLVGLGLSISVLRKLKRGGSFTIY